LWQPGDAAYTAVLAWASFAVSDNLTKPPTQIT
jgi:hypothetical protein